MRNSSGSTDMKGHVMQVQPFSVNDGDGIRTTVFLAGCPLRCKWCSNPEGFDATEKIGWHVRKCIGCGDCTRVCPQGIGIDLNAERDRCIACGACAKACPEQARSYMVRLTDADEVIAQIQKHRLFYSYSGGGVTFSGGEATLQTEFLDYLSSRLYDMGCSMDIETCGLFDFDSVRHILERMDMIFMDLKVFDSTVHEKYTGVPNDRILANMARLAELPAEIVIRIPVVAGVNDDEENIRDSARFVHENLPDARMELLPYHRFGMIKYEALGMEYEGSGFAAPDAEAMNRLRQIVRDEGVGLADFR